MSIFRLWAGSRPEDGSAHAVAAIRVSPKSLQNARSLYRIFLLTVHVPEIDIESHFQSGRFILVESDSRPSFGRMMNS